MTRKLERLIRKGHSTMDVIMVGAWMLSYQNAVDHPPQWMLSRQNASGHGRYHGWALYALCYKQERIKPWTSSWLGPGCFVLRMHEAMDVIMPGPPPAPWMLSCCSLVRMHQTMDVVMVGPWMLWAQNAFVPCKKALDHAAIMVGRWMLASHHPSIASKLPRQSPVSDTRWFLMRRFLRRAGF